MRISLLVLSAFLFITAQSDAVFAQFAYINPKPNSTFHNPETNIILRNGSFIDRSSLQPNLVTLSGSLSGVHSCRIILSGDNKTILIYPDIKFAEGETVDVTVADGFKKNTGEMISGISFTFQTHRHYTPADLQSINDARKACVENEYGPAQAVSSGTRELCSIPDHEIFSTGNEWDGDLFYYNFTPTDPICFARTILTNSGDSIYSAFDNSQGVSFDINENGYLTWYNDNDSSFMMADSTYTVVKEFFMGNGFFADNHDFLVYPDGHSFMFCYDVHPNIDLTQFGGLDTVDVTGLVIQELDADQQVIFEWSSWDHFEIDDAVSSVSLAGVTSVDYVHGNSLDLDYDGNLLLSCRHMSEITKIDLNSGNIIWRLGGENNQFTFINDPDAPFYFSWQHDFKRLPNGHYTLFNNNNHVSLPDLSSSAKEYVLDQSAKTATLVWKYVHPTVNGFKVISNAMGDVERLPNGNTFIDYGLILDVTQPFPRFTEVDSLGNIVWEFRFTVDTVNYVSYRAYKHKWDRCGAPVDSGLLVTNIGTDTADFSWDAPNYASAYIFQYKLTSEINWISIPVTQNFLSLGGLIPESAYNWRIQTICTTFNDSSNYSATQQFSTLSTLASSLNNNSNVAFKLYPNPAGEKVTLSFQMPQPGTITLKVLNAVGAVQLLQSVSAIKGMNEQVISLDGFAAGIYLVELNSAHFSAHTQLVIR